MANSKNQAKRERAKPNKSRQGDRARAARREATRAVSAPAVQKKPMTVAAAAFIRRMNIGS